MRPSRTALLAAAAVAAMLLVLVPAASASAAGPRSAPAGLFDCKTAPTPASPKANGLTIQPKTVSTGDPFTDKNVSIYSVYGNGYHFFRYDNGCSPTSSIMPSVGNAIGNLVGLQIPATFEGLARSFNLAVADPSWLSALDKPVNDATASIGRGVWGLWLSVALICVACLVMWRTRGGQIASALTATLWALAVLVLVSVTLSYPAESVTLVDDAVQTTVVNIGTGFTDNPTGEGSTQQAADMLDQQWDQIARATTYRTWLEGTFGDADSATAATYGPRVFADTHFTWTQWDAYSKNPTGAGKTILDAKQADFQAAADQIKAADPVAYEYFTGNRWDSRLGTAFLGWFVALVVSLFLVISSVGMLLGYLVIRVAVPLSPAAGVVLMLEVFRNAAMGLLRRVAAILVAGPVFLLAALVTLRLNSAVISAAGIPAPIRFGIVGAISFIAWRLIRPASVAGLSHNLTSMVRTATAVRLGTAGDDRPDDLAAGETGIENPAGRRRYEPGRTERPVAVHELPPSPVIAGALPAAGADGDELPELTVLASSRTPGTFVPRAQLEPATLSAREARELSSLDLPTHALPPSPVPVAPGDVPAADTDHALTLEEQHAARQRIAPAILAGGTDNGGLPDPPKLPHATPPVPPHHSPDPAPSSAAGSTPGQAAVPAALSAVSHHVPVAPSQIYTVDEQIPAGQVHEANLSADDSGRPVFTLYRPQGSRRMHVTADQ